MRKIWIANALALSLGAGMLGVLPAHASSKGRRNTALGLGAAAAYELLNGKTTNGLILGAGALYGYKRYKDAKDDERDYRYDRYRRSRSSERYRSSDRYRPVRHDEYETDRYRGDDRYRDDDRYRYDRGQYVQERQEQCEPRR